MYKFGNSTDFDNYTKISKLYSSVYCRIDNVTAFTTYSTEMEQAVLTDKSLSTEVKNVLLMEMATYRYGFYYYSQIN